MAVGLRDYESALRYVRVLEEKDLLFDMVEPDLMFLLLFNGLELHFKDLNRIKDVYTQYASE